MTMVHAQGSEGGHSFRPLGAAFVGGNSPFDTHSPHPEV
jgi:hypothetical protein